MAGWEHFITFCTGTEILVSHFILFNALKTIGSPDNVSSETQPRYVTWKCCFIFISLFFTFSFLTLLICAYLQKEQIWWCLLGSVCLIYCQGTNWKYFQNPCLVIFQFLWHFYVGTWGMRHWHIKIDVVLQPEACC